MKRTSIISLCFGFLAMTATPALAQSQSVKGTVVDENGEPIIGASVRIVGNNSTGVITDVNGNYNISADKGAKVTISYIGYLPQTVVPGGKVQLHEDNHNLEEVVVVGYGSQKKAHLTGSVATVNMEDIQDLSAAGLATTLAGMVNGLSVSGGQARPGENAVIRIRDANDFSDVGSEAQEPLFVIDGFIQNSSAFNNLDPSIVESISVLKDASAAVYGARAANGVIIVTTKKGKLGAPKISYNGTFGFTDEVARTDMLSTYDYGRLYNMVKAADPTKTSLNHTTQLFQADELEAMKHLNYDLLDKYWETGFTQQHAVNVSGATEKANYYASITYFDQDGNLGKLDYDRWTYRAGVDLKISQWFKAKLEVNGSYGKKNKPLVKVGGSNAEKDYNLLLSRPGYFPEEVDGRPIIAVGPSETISDNQAYSFAVLQNNGDYTRTMNNDTYINGALEYDFGWSKILKGLNLRFSYSKSIGTSKNNQYGTDYEMYRMVHKSGSGAHLYTPVAGSDYDALLTGDNFVKYTLSNGNPSFLSRSMSRSDSYQMNFTATYARDFGNHHVSALFSIEKSESEMEDVLARRTEPYEFTTGQWNSASGELANGDAQFSRSEAGMLSYIGRINYVYSNKYLFEFLFRSDASTKFAPRNYWGKFPSASAGWIISEEDWYQKSKLANVVDFLKIRGSFGLTGRDNTNAWQWMRIYAQDAYRGPIFGTGNGNLSDGRLTLNKNNSAVNADVHWDKEYKANIGLDLSHLDRRLGVSFDAYKVWNREMLIKFNKDIPTTVGTQTAATNWGEMDNWGYELSLTWKDKIGKDFKYRVGLNTGYSDNKVLNMDWENEWVYKTIRRGGRTDIGTWGLQCIGMFRSFQDIEEYFDKYGITEYLGLSKDEVRPGMLIYKDVRGAETINEDGSVTYAGPNGIVNENEDQVHLSNRSNPYGFTLNLNASYKNLSLTAQVRASWGGYSMLPSDVLKPKYDLDYTNMPSLWNPDNMFVYQDIFDGSGNLVAKANRNASMPSLAYTDINARQSSFWRVSGTRAELTRITLAYSLPKTLVNSLGLDNVRFNVTGQNVLSLYNPYPDNFMDPMQGGYGKYPNLRKWTVGVNIGF